MTKKDLFEEIKGSVDNESLERFSEFHSTFLELLEKEFKRKSDSSQAYKISQALVDHSFEFAISGTIEFLLDKLDIDDKESNLLNDIYESMEIDTYNYNRIVKRPNYHG